MAKFFSRMDGSCMCMKTDGLMLASKVKKLKQILQGALGSGMVMVLFLLRVTGNSTQIQMDGLALHWKAMTLAGIAT
jgi:hypothetical protein